MKVSTAVILAVGAAPILFVVVEIAREKLTCPFRIDDVGLPYAFIIVTAAIPVLCIGLAKLFVDRWRAKQR